MTKTVLTFVCLIATAVALASERDPRDARPEPPEAPQETAKSDPKIDRGDDAVLSGRKRVVARLDPASEGGAPEETTFVGREIADYRTVSGAGKYVLEDEFGRMRTVPGESVVSIDDAPDSTLGELRRELAQKLLDEFGEGFSTKTTDRYVFVYDASDGYAEWCARLYEDLAKGFLKYAAKNDLELKERLEPMVVVIFAKKEDFVRYASKETPGADKIAAYYNMETNRVALYDLSQTEGTSEAATKRRRTYLETKEFLSRPNAAFNVATIVHEGTHQLAFNLGLFHRTGPFALWTVEGLSLVFETPSGKASQGGWSYRANFPTNERQLAFFRNYAGSTRAKDPFKELVRQDKFNADLQGSYASSWALFYYLSKKRPKELAAYMREIQSKPPFTAYSPNDRVADFEKFFGDDWGKLTENILKFVKRL